MKTFKNCAAQGDVLFRRVDGIPSNAEPVKSESNRTVIAHSETGHDHVFRAVSGVELFKTPDPNVCFLRLAAEEKLEHLREFDTHESILFAPGCYEVRRQVEMAPEGWRRVED